VSPIICQKTKTSSVSQALASPSDAFLSADHCVQGVLSGVALSVGTTHQSIILSDWGFFQPRKAINLLSGDHTGRVSSRNRLNPGAAARGWPPSEGTMNN
jgi:hypothetical protein